MTRKAANDTTRRQRALAGEGDDLPARMSYTEAERDGVHVQKVRLAKMAKKGADWDGKADNDNIAWPLATALIREGNTELLKAAMYYRKVHDTAKSEAKLGGSSVSLGDGVAVDQRQWVKPNGHVAYKGVRVVASSEPETSAKRKSPTDSEEQLSAAKSESGYTNVPKAWNGDMPVNNMIDAQRRLGELRLRLGPLVESIEMAVIDGETYQAIGNASGVADRSGAISAGRAIVHVGLVSLRDAMGNVSRSDLAA
ncbi:hypothetical protein GOL82_16375 [Sinorhizobium medicae]|nr:hypothetical protein [Sinorhizobium medicae]